jgi:hypothetical protein
MDINSPVQLVEDVMTTNRKTLRLLEEVVRSASIVTDKCENILSILISKEFEEAPKQDKRPPRSFGHTSK